MINNQELPIGFTMELAQNPDALNKYSQLSETERTSIAEGAKAVQSRNEMKNYVDNMFR